MKRRLLIGAGAVSLMGVLGQGIAGAAPTPTYTVACVVGFNTTANWQHVKLGRVAFHWVAPAGSSCHFPRRHCADHQEGTARFSLFHDTARCH